MLLRVLPYKKDDISKQDNRTKTKNVGCRNLKYPRDRTDHDAKCSIINNPTNALLLII